MKALCEGNLLGQASMEKLLDFRATGLTEPLECSLGIRRGDFEGYEYWYLGGWDYGYESLVAYFPESCFCISILCNYHGTTTGRIFPALLEVMLEGL